ncbi:MAG: hypothetical protein U5K81_13035 [Trueperaceae bacterium]|nr:hypothetical protein [Trueperaceae bacterium]
MTQQSTTATVPTWVKLAVAVLLVLSLWALFSARSATSTANDNQQRLQVPEIQLSLVPGAPERFPDAFEEAVGDAGAEELDVDALNWVTVLVRNAGGADAEDVILEGRMLGADSVEAIGETSSFQDFEVAVEEGALQMTLNDVDAGETGRVFLGFPNDALPEEVVANWAANYQLAIDRVIAREEDGDEPMVTLFGAAM